MQINDFHRQNFRIDKLDLDLIIAHVIKKPREFVLAHPEYELKKYQVESIKHKASQRQQKEPLAYILRHKEFYGLDFKVNKNTLIPRPETEILIDKALKTIQYISILNNNITVLDVGTGSGNIIISLAHNVEREAQNAKHRKNINLKFIGIDISKEALKIAKQNAKQYKLEKKIKFLHGNLLGPFIGNWKLEIGNSRIFILANLPYLSKKIYDEAMPDVKKYEPKTALLSGKDGMNHYNKLLGQLKKLNVVSCKLSVVCFLEISPEQKTILNGMIRKIFPESHIEFYKDLAGKWRVCKLEL
jgi:release factor glutamine methyltransferase